MVERQCAICRKQGYTVLYEANFKPELLGPGNFSARHNPNRVHHRFVRCDTCGLIYSTPVLEPAILEKFYQASDFLYEKDLENLKKTYGSYLEKCFSFLTSKDSLLEIGCGNGFFLEVALTLGFKKVVGIDPSASAVNAASGKIRPAIIEGVFKPELFEPESFDIICFFQTLDHIYEPNRFLNDCGKLLKKGGLILSIHHNARSLGAKIFGESWPIFDIQHTYLYDRRTTAKIFSNNWFEVISVFPVKNRFSLSHLLGLAPLPAVVKKVLTKFVVLLGLAQTTLRFNPGNIGVIARIRPF